MADQDGFVCEEQHIAPAANRRRREAARALVSAPMLARCCLAGPRRWVCQPVAVYSRRAEQPAGQHKTQAQRPVAVGAGPWPPAALAAPAASQIAAEASARSHALLQRSPACAQRRVVREQVWVALRRMHERAWHRISGLSSSNGVGAAARPCSSTMAFGGALPPPCLVWRASCTAFTTPAAAGKAVCACSAGGHAVRSWC